MLIKNYSKKLELKDKENKVMTAKNSNNKNQLLLENKLQPKLKQVLKFQLLVNKLHPLKLTKLYKVLLLESLPLVLNKLKAKPLKLKLSHNKLNKLLKLKLPHNNKNLLNNKHKLNHNKRNDLK